jgi:formamidopyrimidine-DNA glycosylase
VVIPELPEIETIVRDLRSVVMGRCISGMVVRPKAQHHLLKVNPYTFYEGTIGQEIQTVLRKGKYIIMPLENGNVMVFHLGMTGKLLVQTVPDLSFDERFNGEDAFDKHTHLVMELTDLYNVENDDLELCFNDVRLFGSIWLVENVDNIDTLDVPGLRELGPDALGISLQEFEQAVCNKRAVKSSLLDQNNLAGVGNIYADEACFIAKVHPATKGSALSMEQKLKLWFAVKTVLKEGIRYGGSSVSDYTTVDGNKGAYQEHHRVYGRFGQKCVECESAIRRIKVAGRSTHYCPSCQPKGD